MTPDLGTDGQAVKRLADVFEAPLVWITRLSASRLSASRLLANLLLAALLFGVGFDEAKAARPCDRKVRPSRAADCGHKTKAPTADVHFAIETGGTSPAIDTQMAVLRKGTFRLDMSAYFADYISAHPGHSNASTIQSAFVLGYGLTDRLTLYAGAIESNRTNPDGPFVAEFFAPKVGFAFRLATASQFWGNTLDVVSDFGANEVLKPPIPSPSPYGDIGSTLKSRLVVTREMGHGLILQASGGLQTAFVETHYGSVSNDNTYLNAVVGLAGQYRLSAISNRLYLNGELDWLRPLTDAGATKMTPAPFGILESYSATLGASYAIRPAFVILRLSDTVAYDLGSDGPCLPGKSGHVVTNTVGLTLSVLGKAPLFGL